MAIISKKLAAVAVSSAFLLGAAFAANGTAIAVVTATVVSTTTVSLGNSGNLAFPTDLTDANIASGNYNLASANAQTIAMSVTDTNASDTVLLQVTPGSNASIVSGVPSISKTSGTAGIMGIGFKATSCGATGTSVPVNFAVNGSAMDASASFPATVLTSAACTANPGSFIVGLNGGQNPPAGAYSGSFTIMAIPQ